jgi:hypothetical protein
MLAIEDQFAGVEITDDDDTSRRRSNPALEYYKAGKAIAVTPREQLRKDGTWCKVEHCKCARCSGGDIRTLIDGR